MAETSDFTANSYKRLGTKYATLMDLAALGLAVPDGFCISVDEWDAFASITGLGRSIDEKLIRIGSQPILTAKILSEIRDIIMEVAWPEELQYVLMSAASLLQSGSVAVRSSGIEEDGGSRSHAGVFHSEAPVTDLASVQAAIRRVWASAYTERAYFYCQGNLRQNLAVIVQRFIEAEWAGVAFSVDPISREDAIVVEASPGNNHSITAGIGTARRLTIPRGSLTDSALSAELLRTMQRIEAFFGGPVDVEWAFVSGRIVVLQARFMTALTSREVVVTRWHSQEDVEAVYGMPLGLCGRLFARQLQKKVWYRQVCTDNDIGIYKILYICYDPKSLQDKKAELLSEFSMPTLRVSWGDFSLSCGRDQLLDVLVKYADQNPVGDGTFATAQIGDVIPANATGFSSVVNDEEVFVEAFPPGLEGLKSGALQASWYRLNKVNEEIGSSEQVFDHFGVMDGATGSWRSKEVTPFVMTMSSNELDQIAHATRTLANHFGEVRVEWYAYRGRIYIKDLSLESSPLSFPAGASVLSIGTSKGTIHHIDDISVFEEIARSHDISIVNYTLNQDTLLAEAAVQPIREKWEDGESIICVAEYPSIGLIPLIPYVAGFIFERGNLLCHTAIVLRERLVPAVVLADARAVLSPLSTVLLSDSEVRVFASTNVA